MGGFLGRDVLSIAEFSRQEIEHILRVADDMVVDPRKGSERALAGRILATVFFEPSTRTRLSFESAMKRLGGDVVSFGGLEGTSVAKGETLSDTIRMVEAYSDAIVLRHPQEGAARLAAEFSSKPVINGGDGAGQHPTQTLLDLYTIWDELDAIDGKTIALVGDLKYGRTVHSLVLALCHFDVDLYCIAPPTLQLPPYLVNRVKELGRDIKTAVRPEEHIADVDVLYTTRIQKERFPDAAEYARVAGSYRVDLDMLREAKKHLIVMHPLPRLQEIAPEVDRTPHAKYFQQAQNGVRVRMALLSLLFGVVS
jgi:aspartate carbamoyltransferase catalytic subunit